jgi:hypothetical protein
VDAFTPYELQMSLARLDGPGALTYRCSDQVRHMIEVSHPGTYRVSFGPIEGYGVLDPIDVRVTAAENPVVYVELSK